MTHFVLVTADPDALRAAGARRPGRADRGAVEGVGVDRRLQQPAAGAAMIDLRSDTVTRPGAGDARGDGGGGGRRRRLRRRSDGAPRCRSSAAALFGMEAGALLPERHAVQPGGADEPLPARRGVHRRPGSAHLPLRGGRRGGARQRPAAAARQPRRTARSTSPRSRRRSSRTIRTSRARACSRSRTRSAGGSRPRLSRVGAGARADGAASRRISTARGSSTPR